MFKLSMKQTTLIITLLFVLSGCEFQEEHTTTFEEFETGKKPGSWIELWGNANWNIMYYNDSPGGKTLAYNTLSSYTDCIVNEKIPESKPGEKEIVIHGVYSVSRPIADLYLGNGLFISGSPETNNRTGILIRIRLDTHDIFKVQFTEGINGTWTKKLKPTIGKNLYNKKIHLKTKIDKKNNLTYKIWIENEPEPETWNEGFIVSKEMPIGSFGICRWAGRGNAITHAHKFSYKG